MTNIIIVSGASAVGKDAIVKSLSKEIKPLVSDTTRPKRDNETNGVDYNFVSKETFLSNKSKEGYIETREYETQEGIWYYGLSENTIERALVQGGNYVVILDPQGKDSLVRMLDRYLLEPNITTVFITASMRTRINRYMNRTHTSKIQYLEMFRRFLADEKEVESFKDEYDIILTNEDEEDLKRNIKLIKNLLTNN
jgi:guanylate kinase